MVRKIEGEASLDKKVEYKMYQFKLLKMFDMYVWWETLAIIWCHYYLMVIRISKNFIILF